MSATISINTTQVVRDVRGFTMGVNLAAWDTYLSADSDTGLGVAPDPRTVGMIRDAGLGVLRLSNGSGADEWHFSSNANAFPIGAGLLANIMSAAGTAGLATRDANGARKVGTA